MMRSPLAPLFLLVLFLVQLFAGFGEARGLVWCFSAGGGVRLETLPEGGCEAVGPCTDEAKGERPAEGHGAFDFTGDHCGDCFDLPALSASFRHSPRFPADAGFPSVLSPTFPETVFSALPARDERPGFTPHSPPPDSPFLLALRTVVLRN